MPRLHSTIFRTDDNKLAAFLHRNFDFEAHGQFLRQSLEQNNATSIEIDVNPTCQKLKSNAPYWKTGVLMPDVRKHVSRLSADGIHVSDPAQFKDIGFLCHTEDSDGNCIELLQHDFEANFRGGFDSNPVTVGQITIRTSKLKETIDFYSKRLGMKMLSIQPVGPFDLYFLGYTDDVPPSVDDLKALENREWLWKKPYCTIEIQEVRNRVIQDYEDLHDDEKGWMGMRIKATKQEAADLIKVHESTMIRDPNNIPVYVDVE